LSLEAHCIAIHTDVNGAASYGGVDVYEQALVSEAINSRICRKTTGNRQILPPLTGSEGRQNYVRNNSISSGYIASA
jgi:hypothetical protein